MKNLMLKKVKNHRLVRNFYAVENCKKKIDNGKYFSSRKNFLVEKIVKTIKCWKKLFKSKNISTELNH